MAKGKTSYGTNCVIWNGEKCDGCGPAGSALSPKPRNFAVDKFKKGTTPVLVFTSISKGLDGTSMAAFGHLPEAERWALAHYVLCFPKR